MNENRLTDYLDHMQQAAMDACAFVEDASGFVVPNQPYCRARYLCTLLVGRCGTSDLNPSL